MGHHEDESLLDKVKNALGMGDDDGDRADRKNADGDLGDADRADGWAGVPEALHDDPAGTGTGEPARYEDGATVSDLGGTDLDASGDPDLSREDAVATEFGGAYGADETAMPTDEALDRGTTADDPDLIERRTSDF